jgi:hypothetical protein
MKKINRLPTVGTACGLLVVDQLAMAKKIVIGASLLAQQHTFYL